MNRPSRRHFVSPVEALEARRVMTGNYLINATIDIDTDLLVIKDGSYLPDRIVVQSIPGGGIRVLGSRNGPNDLQQIVVDNYASVGGDVTPRGVDLLPGIVVDCHWSDQGHSVDLTGIDPAVSARLKATMIGGHGADSLTGLAYGRNTIYGMGGDDILTGGAANDLLVAGSANGSPDSERGNSTLHGEAGDDTLIGGWGIVELDGGPGNDTLIAHSSGWRGQPWTEKTRLEGGDGNDKLIASSANDDLFGGAGNDILIGGTGNNLLDGGDGNDLLVGNGGLDSLFGRAGNDTIISGGAGKSVVYGGGGSNLLTVKPVDTVLPTVGAIDYRTDRTALVAPGARAAATDLDVHQPLSAGTCWWLAPLAAVAGTRDLSAGIRPSGIDLFDVTLYRGGKPVVQTVSFDGTLNAGDPVPSQDGEFWAVLYQRALIQELKPGLDWRDEAAVAASDGNAALGLAALTGQATGVYAPARAGTLATLKQALAQGRPAVADTQADPAAISPMLVGSHSYQVVSIASIKGVDYVTLRNPWGVDGALPSGNPIDGVVVLRWSDFAASTAAVLINGTAYATKAQPASVAPTAARPHPEAADHLIGAGLVVARPHRHHHAGR